MFRKTITDFLMLSRCASVLGAGGSTWHSLLHTLTGHVAPPPAGRLCPTPPPPSALSPSCARSVLATNMAVRGVA